MLPSLAFLAAGTASLAVGLLDPRFRDAEGFLDGGACLALSIGVALLLIGWGWRRRERAAVLWLALALVGQAAALQLVDAGPHVHYQHYRSPGELAADSPLLAAFLLVQAALVAAGFRSRVARLGSWMARTLRGWQWLGVVCVSFLLAAAVSRQPGAYMTDLIVAGLVQAVCLGSLVLAATALPEDALARWRRRIDALLGPPGHGERAARGPDRVALAAAAWVTLSAATLNVAAYERYPHVQDELVYLQHARYLAHGVLTMPAPPVPDAFYVYLMRVDGDRWYPSMPPGWPAVLSLGVRAGAPWLVNPVLAGLDVLLAFLLLRRLYDRRTARLAALLLAASPWNVFLGMSWMTHTLTLACALVGALSIVHVRRTGRWGWALVAGAAIGYASLIRPLDGFVLAALLGLWALGLGGARLPVRALAGLVGAAALVGALALPYNGRLTGDPLRFPVMAYMDERWGPGSSAYGFGPDVGVDWPLDPFPGHGPLDAMVNADLNGFSLNVELFGWGTGSLLLFALALFGGAIRREDRPFFAAAVGVFVAYFFYYFGGGPDFGARYWSLMLVPLVVLSVRGIAFLEGTLAGAGGRVIPAVLALSAMALVNFVPWRAADKYHRYLGMRPDVAALAAEHDFGRSLVLVRGNPYPDYASAAAWNPLDLHDDAPVYAWDKSPEVRRRVVAAYPDRPVWVLQGPSLTGAGYRIAAGPLSPRELLARAPGTELVSTR